MGKIFELRKSAYRRDVFIFGHRVFSFLRKGIVAEAILHHLVWQADYRILRQHGIELPGESAHYWTGGYEVLDVRLGDLRRFWQGKAVSLNETDLFKFVSGEDKEGIHRYYDELGRLWGHSKESAKSNVEDSERLFKDMEGAGYDPSVSCITINDKNVILDGFHRSTFLLVKHGPDFKVKVVRILPNLR